MMKSTSLLLLATFTSVLASTRLNISSSGRKLLAVSNNCSTVIGFDGPNILQSSILDPLALVGVKGISYSISYSVTDAVRSIQALETKDVPCNIKMARIINKAGAVSSAGASGAQAAVRATNFNDPQTQQCSGFGLCANVWDTDQQDAYPISFLAYVVVPTNITNSECETMKVVYDFLTWAITDPSATYIATAHDYASLPVKFAKSVLSDYLNSMKCANAGFPTTYRSIVNEQPTSKALAVQGSGSNMMQGLLAALLSEYSGAGVATISYDGSIGTGAGLCQLTVGTTSCWFNTSSKETVPCIKWDAKKVNCLLAGPPGVRTSFAGSPSIIEMRSLTVQRQGQRMIPLFAAAIGIVYNLPTIDGLILSRDVANKIFIGEISAWNDPLIQDANQGVSLPNRQIIRLVRSDNAAATQILARSLASFANTNNQYGTGSYWLKHVLQGSATPTWPVANTTGLNQNAVPCVLEHCGRSICPVGKHFDPVLDVCWDCPRGTYMDTSGQPLACKPCEPGHYSDTPGVALCTKCGENTYQNASGQTACRTCPANTRRFLVERTVVSSDNSSIQDTVDTPAISIEECMCNAGFWLPSSVHNLSVGGDECVACPTGAVCLGFLGSQQSLPTTLEGYWGDRDFPTTFYECKEVTACNADYECGEGHHGRMCEEATSGYFIVGRKWFLQCPSHKPAAAALTVFFTAIVLFVWLSIMRLAEASVHESIDISAKFLHLLSFIAEFRLRWHPYLDPVVLVLLIVNIEVDFVGPQCVWPAFNGVALFYLQLAFPFVIILCSTLVWYFKRRFFSTGISLSRALENPILNKTCIRDGTISISDFWTAVITQGLICFSYMYQVLAYRAFSSFSCTKYANGEYLRAVPDIECGSNVHTGMMVTSAFYIVFVLLAFPIIMLRILLIGRSQNQLTDSYFIQRFGTFYEQFKLECVWWEIAIIARKLCMSLILALVELPMIQGALAIILIYFSICFHISNLPYLDHRHNLLEAACLFCALTYVLCGMIFYPSLNSSPICIGTELDSSNGGCLSTGEIKKGFSLVLIFLVIMTVGLAISSALWEVYERRQSKSASDFIASKQESWNTVKMFLSARWMFEQTFRSKLLDVEAIENRNDTNNSQPYTRFHGLSESNPDVAEDDDLKLVQLHLSHMLNGCKLAEWKNWLIDMKQRGENIQLKYALNNCDVGFRNQVNMYTSLDGVLPKCAMRFKNALSPTSNSNLAGIAMQLQSLFPGLIDFLLTSKDEVRTGLFDFMESFLFFTAQNPKLQQKFQVASCERAIFSEYRSVVAHWIMTCNEEDVARYRKFVKLLYGRKTVLANVPKSRFSRAHFFTDLGLKSGFRKCSIETCEQLRPPQEHVKRTSTSVNVCDAMLHHDSNPRGSISESTKLGLSAMFVDITSQEPSGSIEMYPEGMNGGKGFAVTPTVLQKSLSSKLEIPGNSAWWNSGYHSNTDSY